MIRSFYLSLWFFMVAFCFSGCFPKNNGSSGKPTSRKSGLPWYYSINKKYPPLMTFIEVKGKKRVRSPEKFSLHNIKLEYLPSFLAAYHWEGYLNILPRDSIARSRALIAHIEKIVPPQCNRLYNKDDKMQLFFCLDGSLLSEEIHILAAEASLLAGRVLPRSGSSRRFYEVLSLFFRANAWRAAALCRRLCPIGRCPHIMSKMRNGQVCKVSKSPPLYP